MAVVSYAPEAEEVAAAHQAEARVAAAVAVAASRSLFQFPEVSFEFLPFLSISFHNSDAIDPTSIRWGWILFSVGRSVYMN